MALRFILLFDKNKTPLPILKQRKKRITLLSQKYKSQYFFPVIKEREKKGWRKATIQGSARASCSFHKTLPQKTKKSHILKHHGESGFFYSEDLEQFQDHSQVYLSGFERSKFRSSQPCNQKPHVEKPFAGSRRAWPGLLHLPHHQLTHLLFTEPANAQHLLTPGSLSKSNTSEKEAGGLYLSTHQNHKYLISFSPGTHWLRV